MRRAYRDLAQRLHPDRLGATPAAERGLAERRMREINASWQVLKDPVRRRAYDESRLGRPPRSERTAGGRPGPVPVTGLDRTGDDDLVDVLPPMTALGAGLMRHLPWVVIVAVFGVIFVLSAYAGGDREPDRPRTPTAAGDCIDVAPGPSTTVVPCAGPHDLRIVRRVSDPGSCPTGAESRRLGTDGLFDCVRSGSSTTSTTSTGATSSSGAAVSTTTASTGP